MGFQKGHGLSNTGRTHFKKGQSGFWKGKQRPDLSLKLKNRVFSEESKLKMSNSMKGNKNHKGHTHSEETKLKISENKKKYYLIPSKHWNWKGGITSKIQAIRSKTYSWRKDILKNNKYTCQHCGYIGKDLNAHHIKSFAKFPELRFDINNGITLCKECHFKEHKRLK